VASTEVIWGICARIQPLGWKWAASALNRGGILPGSHRMASARGVPGLPAVIPLLRDAHPLPGSAGPLLGEADPELPNVDPGLADAKTVLAYGKTELERRFPRRGRRFRALEGTLGARSVAPRVEATSCVSSRAR